MALDPKTVRAEREQKKAENRPEDEPLDPPFPYRRLPFDVFFFGLDKEPAKSKPSPFPEVL